MGFGRISCVASLAFILLIGSVQTARASCGAAGVCADTMASFWGDIEIEGIRASWSTDSEADDFSFYVLKRYDCGDPASCSVTIATVSATGECDRLVSYQLDDDPPAPVSSWTYTLEVWRTNNTRACAIDTTPK